MDKPVQRQSNVGAEPVLSLSKEETLLPMTRGGKRPGAGAPTGNLNALKTGRRSRQLKLLYADLALHPVFRNLLLRQHMKHISRPSRVRLRRLYLDLLARLIASQYIQSRLTDIVHKPPGSTP
ncbi:MAG: hypothetical protein ABID84_04910 [Chloroflexota bacterium]